ncbi:hypothetical protein [uncultured Maribacter sp.]|uniref:hypothetical protein n=1 Tax=uncultured Maribacter sp. TaxID=431308 RepID=UPI00262BE2B4|nr:hypothetical protein [uncultured Maribacter sp.]
MKTSIRPIDLDFSSLFAKTKQAYVCFYSYEYVRTGSHFTGGTSNLIVHDYSWVLTASSCETVLYYDEDYKEYHQGNTATVTIGGTTYGGTGGSRTSPIASPFDREELRQIDVVKNRLNLNRLEKLWIDKWENGQYAFKLHDFLSADMFSDEAIEFSKFAVKALMDGGEVDFEEELILDSDLKDNDCLYSVYTGMGKASIFANYLNNFDGDMSVANLKLTSSTTLDANTNAETSAPQNYLITITFNENNLNRPILSIARTFIHEMIHAETFRKLLSVAQHSSIQLDQNQLIQLRSDYPGLYDYYMRWKWNVPQGQSPSSAQHEAMAQHYRDIIKQALKEFDNSQTDEIYEALAWTGLQNTVAWNNLTQTKRDSISQTITDFNTNNPNCQ